MALDINTVGSEFVKNIISIYRSTKYYREKEILAKKLLDSSIEAGSLIAELGTCPESREDGIARRALEYFDKTMFILKVMGEEGIYPARRIKPITALAEQIKDLLDLYMTDDAPQTQASTPAPQPAPAPVPAPIPRAETAALPAPSEDLNAQLALLKLNDGGFNDIYTGPIKNL